MTGIKQARVAFSGSGFLAPIHAGGFCAFTDAGLTTPEVAGTSGGSIMAALIAAGKTAAEIKAIALADLPDGIVSYNLFMLFKQGLNSGSVLTSWLQSLLGDITFAQTVIPITIMASDVNNHCSYRFSNKETPNVKLVDACRASASIPVIYTPVTINGVKLQDGGMCCNIPVDQLVDDSIQRYGIEVMDGSTGTTNTIFGLVEADISTMLKSNEDNLAAWAVQTGAVIIPVDATPYSVLNASMTPDQKAELFARGYAAVKTALNKA
jgi:NTE family protein